MNTIGERINSLIKRSGITQKKLAVITNIPLRTLANIIKGDVEPGLHKINSIAQYFNVSLDWLVNGSTYDIIDKGKHKTKKVAEESSVYQAMPSSIAKRIAMIADICDGPAKFASSLDISEEKLNYFLSIDIPEEILDKIIECACEKGKTIDLNWLLTGEKVSDRLIRDISGVFDQEELTVIKNIIDNLLKLSKEQMKAVLLLIETMKVK